MPNLIACRPIFRAGFQVIEDLHVRGPVNVAIDMYIYFAGVEC